MQGSQCAVLKYFLTYSEQFSERFGWLVVLDFGLGFFLGGREKGNRVGGVCLPPPFFVFHICRYTHKFYRTSFKPLM